MSAAVLLDLYISHFLQTFGERLWQFAIPMFLTQLFNDTLLPQSIYAFAIYSVVFLFMPSIGSYIDKASRLSIITISIWGQNICIIISCLTMYILSYIDDHNFSFILMLFIIVLLVSMIGHLFGQATALSLEKDWIVVLCQNDSKLLINTNAKMRRIDLLCKILAPALFGIYFEYFCENQSKTNMVYFACLAIIAWNILEIIIGYPAIKRFYCQNEKILSVKRTTCMNMSKRNYSCIDGWIALWRSDIFLPSMAYCMLYINALSGGSLVTSYLKIKGISYSILGLNKGFGALCGILGIQLTEMLHDRYHFSMGFIGIVTIWIFWLCLTPIGICRLFMYDENIVYLYIMLISMVIGRLFLWSFDLTIHQLTQLKVNKMMKAEINGAHMALCQLFSVLSSILGMIFNQIDQFFILINITLIIINIACITYSFWCFKQKTKLQ